MKSEYNIYRTFLQYVSLNVLSMIGLSCYILADTYFISSGVGSEGIAALNLVLPVYSLVSGIGLMFGMGGATRFSILRGQGRDQEASVCFTYVVRSSVACGIVLMTIGIFFSSDIARLLGADQEIKPYAQAYLRTILMFPLAFLMNQILICFIRNDGRPNLAMAAMLCGSFGNIILDYIFIFPLKLGMSGAALATGIAPVLSMIILSSHFLKKKNHFHLMKNISSAGLMKRVLSLGLASFITEFSSGIIMLIFNFIILGLTGSMGVAAYGIIANLVLVAAAVFTGIAQGIQPIISLNLGRKNIENIKKTLFCAILFAVSLGVGFYLAGYFWAKPIAGIFNKEQNGQLSQMAEQGICLSFLAFPAMGFNIVVSAFFAAFSRPVQSFAVSIIRGAAAVIPLAFLLTSLFHMTGTWLSIPAAEILTGMLSIGLFLRVVKDARINGI